MVGRSSWGGRSRGLCWGLGRQQGGRAALGRADLSAVGLLGVLQSEFMEAMEMTDICL